MTPSRISRGSYGSIMRCSRHICSIQRSGFDSHSPSSTPPRGRDVARYAPGAGRARRGPGRRGAAGPAPAGAPGPDGTPRRARQDEDQPRPDLSGVRPAGQCGRADLGEGERAEELPEARQLALAQPRRHLRRAVARRHAGPARQHHGVDGEPQQLAQRRLDLRLPVADEAPRRHRVAGGRQALGQDPPALVVGGGAGVAHGQYCDARRPHARAVPTGAPAAGAAAAARARYSRESAT